MVESPARKAATVGKLGAQQIPVRPKVVDLNLIPLEFRRPLVTRSRLFMLTVIITASIVFPRVYAAQVDFGSKMATVQQRLASVTSIQDSESRRIATQNAEAARLEEQIAGLKDQAAQKSASAKVETQTLRRYDLAPGLEALLTSASDGLEVTSVNWQEPNVTVEGTAPSLPVLISYTKRLQESGRYRQLSLRLIDEVSENTGQQASVPANLGPAAKGTPAPTPVPANAIRRLSFQVKIALPTDGS